MKKQWNSPQIANLSLKETESGVVCPYKQNDNSTTFEMFGPEKCCPCEFYKDCSKTHKYTGACQS